MVRSSAPEEISAKWFRVKQSAASWSSSRKRFISFCSSCEVRSDPDDPISLGAPAKHDA